MPAARLAGHVVSSLRRCALIPLSQPDAGTPGDSTVVVALVCLTISLWVNAVWVRFR